MASKNKQSLARAAWLCGALSMLSHACGSRVDIDDSQTHWLVCKDDTECDSASSCIDKVCVKTPADAPDASPDAAGAASSPLTSAPIATSSPSDVDADVPPKSCDSRSVLDCAEPECSLILGTNSDGVQGAYGCQEADRSCPPVITCALDPYVPSHPVQFGGCTPSGWLIDRSEPSACADVTPASCSAFQEADCLANSSTCQVLYGAALDGSSYFAECVISGFESDGALTCATDGLGGAPLLFATTAIPEGWVAEASLAACQPECFSPWRNTDRIGDDDLRGCPCASSGSVCLEGQGLICQDLTQDVTYNPNWTVSQTVCDAAPECDGGDRLQYCLEHYEVCTESGSIVLDEGTVLYCGDTPLDCALRDEKSCTDGCFPYIGRRPGSSTGEFISCGTTQCFSSRTVCATDADANWVDFYGCKPPDWTEVDSAVCQG